MTSEINKSEYCILVSSCDDYCDLWPVFFQLFFQYLPNPGCKVYLQSNFKKYEDPRVTTLAVGKDKAWGQNMLTALDEITEPYVVYFQDDYLLNKPFNIDAFERLLTDFSGVQGLYCSLFHRRELGVAVGNTLLREILKDSKETWIADFQVSLWKREMLLSMAEKKADVWDTEHEIRQLRFTDIQGFYYLREDAPAICSYIEGVKGKFWLPQAVEFCRERNINLDLKKRPCPPQGQDFFSKLRRSFLKRKMKLNNYQNSSHEKFSNIDNLLYNYATSGPIKTFRDSAFRKYCRRNAGKKKAVICHSDFKMNCVIGDAVDNQLAVHKVYEAETTRIIERLVTEVDYFLDIGCNIGYFLCLSCSTNPDVQVVAVEPNPEMVNRASANLDLNQFTNAKLLNYGVGAAEGRGKLNIPKNRHSLASFAYQPTKGGDCKQIEASIVTLNSLIKEHQLVNCLIKIDAEGYEYEILSGLDNKYASYAKFIILELSAKNLKLSNRTTLDILSMPFIELFDLYLIEKSKEVKLTKIQDLSIQTQLEIESNILMIRNDISKTEIFEISN